MALIHSKKWLTLLLPCFLIIALVLTGCTSSSSTSATISTSTQLSGTITESGSTTVQPLAEVLAEDFRQANPNVKVIIQGGGSSVGIKAVNDGTVDLGAASREMTQDDPALVTHLLARDGIAVIVNPANPVNGLTKTQIRDIYSGSLTNWNQVGGEDHEIHVSAREEGSGTRTAFQDMVMGKDANGNAISITTSAILQSSNGALVQVVKSDSWAIGFVSFGYLGDSVKALSIDGVAATEENAKNGTYPIVRPLYFLTKEQPAGLVKAFLDYCTSTAAQKIITDEGYISVQ